MREYATISPKFWTGKTGKELRSHGPEIQVVAIYLMTGPLSNALGLYYIPEVMIAYETGLSPAVAAAAMKTLIDIGYCDYDYDHEIVWIYEMARFQISDYLQHTDKRVKWIRKELEKLPDCPFIQGFIRKYNNRYHIKAINVPSKGLRRGFEGASEKKTKKESEQEQEQEQEQDINMSDSESDRSKNTHNYNDDFLRFWAELLRKEKKPVAWKAWLALKKKGVLPGVDELIQAYRLMKGKKGQEWTKEGGKYHPLPSSLLNSFFWEDVENMKNQGGSGVGLSEKKYNAGEYECELDFNT